MFFSDDICESEGDTIQSDASFSKESFFELGRTGRESYDLKRGREVLSVYVLRREGVGEGKKERKKEKKKPSPKIHPG